jgi:predicted ATP-grasp superfamily ATP-dependent carboligase
MSIETIAADRMLAWSAVGAVTLAGVWVGLCLWRDARWRRTREAETQHAEAMQRAVGRSWGYGPGDVMLGGALPSHGEEARR